MDGHVEEGSLARERPTEPEERLRKKTKQPRERNYGVNIFFVSHQRQFYVSELFSGDKFRGCNFTDWSEP